MPAQMFNCVICGAEVSKKKSYSTERLNIPGEGRACRHHNEVKAAQDGIDAEEQVRIERAEAEAVIRKAQLALLPSQIRMQEYIQGSEFMHFQYWDLRRKLKLTNDELYELKQAVAAEPPVTNKRATDALAAFITADIMRALRT